MARVQLGDDALSSGLLHITPITHEVKLAKEDLEMP